MNLTCILALLLPISNLSQININHLLEAFTNLAAKSPLSMTTSGGTPPGST